MSEPKEIGCVELDFDTMVHVSATKGHVHIDVSFYGCDLESKEHFLAFEAILAKAKIAAGWGDTAPKKLEPDQVAEILENLPKVIR